MPFPFWPFKQKIKTQKSARTRENVQARKSVQASETVKLSPERSSQSHTTPKAVLHRNPWSDPKAINAEKATAIRRHFYNEPRFQCYATFFPHWGGWITAGHCITEAGELPPPFAKGDIISWPGGLDAALLGCKRPAQRPSAPIIGQEVILQGYPAGSRHLEHRSGHVYIERGSGSGTWIAHIETPDEPVVSGMSGGPVINADTGEPIGIIITRNSPADLNNDRDPDESCDFIALSSVWDALENPLPKAPIV